MSKNSKFITQTVSKIRRKYPELATIIMKNNYLLFVYKRHNRKQMFRLWKFVQSIQRRNSNVANYRKSPNQKTHLKKTSLS